MTRAYVSTTRQAKAQETRTRIVETAAQMLLRDGLAAMTVADLAREAGVSPQTVYNSVGGKAEVVKAAYDVRLAGDHDAVPMLERPAYLAVRAATDASSYAAAYAHWSADIFDRVGPLLGVLLFHGTAGDPMLEQFVATINTERRTGNAVGLRFLVDHGFLADGEGFERLVDEVWTLTSPENWHRLVQSRGWARAAYEDWLARHLHLAVTTAAAGTS
ncbi:MAG TPA: TetR/AcrR family transcriptional regulator [Nocardioides sp.]|nr:TetR/AcrR family transcriptional regulator [Nocardioides sp.]